MALRPLGSLSLCPRLGRLIGIKLAFCMGLPIFYFFPMFRLLLLWLVLLPLQIGVVTFVALAEVLRGIRLLFFRRLLSRRHPSGSVRALLDCGSELEWKAPARGESAPAVGGRALYPPGS